MRVVRSFDRSRIAVHDVGVQGAAGATGPQGPPGAAGAAGATGPQGPAGPAASSLVTVTASTAIGGHRAVHIQADGTATYADATNLAHTWTAVGVTTGAAAAGAPLDVQVFGPLDEPTWTWTPGGPVFLGLTGLLTQTPPAVPAAAFQRVLGVAVTPTRLWVEPQAPIHLT